MSRGGKRTRSQSLEYRKPEIGIRTAGFGDDYIPFEFEDDNFRTGEDIPRKRKHEEVEEKVSEQKKFDRRPRLARYEDGTFTTPWMRNMKSSVPESAARFFHDEVEAFTRYISPTPAENELRRLIVKEIEIYARKIWSDATANAFGSVATGLYLPTGDIDVVIETVHVSSLSKASTQTALMRLANALRNAGLAERRKIQVIAARVPIIKFNSVHGGIPIDISINQTNGIKAITMIKKYLDRFPALRSLILVVKAYLNQRGMNEVYKGGLGSYSIICLAISFLQMHPKVRLGEINPSENLGVLVVEFFELYGFFFNYNGVGVSINNGGSYFLKKQRGWLDLAKPWLLSIIDPTDETNDISRGSFQMLRLKQTLGGAALILSSRLLEASEHIQSLQRGYYFSLRPQRPIETILGSIVAISPQALEQRQAIRAAFSSGRIHRSLGIPPPGVHESSEPEGDDSSSDMEQSDTTSLVIFSHKASGRQDEKAPPRTDDPATDTEETDADPSHTTSRNIDGQNHKGEDEEDSRYASTRFRATAATGTSTPPGRRTLNRFNPLSDLKVEYVITSSEESDTSTNGSKGAPLAHANKKRQLDTELTKDSRRASRRKYWAGKAQLENADQSIV